jgi:hypothetical protein
MRASEQCVKKKVPSGYRKLELGGVSYGGLFVQKDLVFVR